MEFKKRKILALSDYGSSGISESLRVPMRAWHDAGHEVWHLALGFNGWGSGIDKEMYPWWERLLPIFGVSNNADRFGQRVLHNAIKASGAEIVISSFDVWMISYLAVPERSNLNPEVLEVLGHGKRTFKHIAYFPLDGAVLGEYLPMGMEEFICGFDAPVTYSKFAQNIVGNDLNLDIPFIPIAHDPQHYYPGDRGEARDALGLPSDKFIVGMVATNQYRKSWGEFFTAVAPFAKAHEDVLILPWTTWDQKIAGGAEITDLIWRFGLEKQVIDPKPLIGSLNDKGMGNLYRSLDTLVLTTIGEGAGLPPIRARACGTPALVSANTSNIEFVADDFELIPVNGKYFDPFGSNLERYTTDTTVLTEKLETLYADRAFRDRLGAIGSEAMKQYEVANIMPLWDKVLETL